MAVYLCRHLHIVTYELYKIIQQYMIQVLKGNSGLDFRWPATEQGDLKSHTVSIITISNLDECQLFRFIVPTGAEF